MSLDQQQSIILELLATTHYIDVDAPDATKKREAKYAIGQACNKAREILCSDEAFLDWAWENVIAECSITDLEEVTPNTLNAWRLLPKFGTLAECEMVGFTHISKLLLEKNKAKKAQLLAIIANHDAATAKKRIKAILKPVVDYAPIVADQQQLADAVANANNLSKEALVAMVKAMHQKMISA